MDTLEANSSSVSEECEVSALPSKLCLPSFNSAPANEVL